MSDVSTEPDGHLEEKAATPVRPRSATLPTYHYTELPAAKEDDPLATEWNFYRRAATRLLAEGHEGKWVLVKGDAIVGMWNTMYDAELEGLQRFSDKLFLIHQVREREPLYRVSWRFWGCPG